MGLTTARATIVLAALATRLPPAVVTVAAPPIVTLAAPPVVTLPTTAVVTLPTPAVTVGVVVIVGGLAALELGGVAVFAAVLWHVLAGPAVAAVKRLVHLAATRALIRLTHRMCGVLRAPETVGDLTGPARQLRVLGRHEVVTRSVGT